VADQLTYVLITPARNEASFIELTIRSVVSQTVLPKKWVIVSDGSTDGTHEIVKEYTAKHQSIELIRMPERKERHFAGKVYAFNAGYERCKGLTYDVIGNLDADISFDEDYFSFLLSRFAGDDCIGVAGTPFAENGTHYDFRYASLEHVSGACQLFRRECFEQIGGYVPIKGGGIDWTAVTTARMKGWKTRTYIEKTCTHHRTVGTGSHGALISNFRYGQKNYVLGGHPLWNVIRACHMMKKKPYIVAGAMTLAGFGWAAVTRKEKSVPPDVIAFHRAEQIRRLKKILSRSRGDQE
jgi:glycosyltransferase involved in cell wall biosynthesis